MRLDTGNKEYTPIQLAHMERRGKASEHEQIMRAKYGWHSDAYLNWRSEKGVREYPMPYAHGYPHYFFEVFFSWNAESSIIDKLYDSFIGDEADAFYIKGLFIKAEDYGLFTNGASCILYPDGGAGLYHVGCLLPVEPPCNAIILHGSEANKARRNMIEQWLVMRADYLTKESPEVSTIVDPTYTELSAYLHKKCSVEICDKAAALAGLQVGEAPRSHLLLRVHALAQALEETQSLKTGKGNIDRVRAAVAKRYDVGGYKRYDPQHSKGPNGRNETWDACYMAARTSIRDAYNKR
jgi:hypothetical protein